MSKTIKELLRSKNPDDIEKLKEIELMISSYKRKEIDFMVAYCKIYYVCLTIGYLILGIALMKIKITL